MTYTKSILSGFTFFILIVLIALATYYFSLGECPNGSLSCDNGTLCIPQKLICNFENDCKDQTDENDVMCGNLYGSDEVVELDFAEGMRKVFEMLNRYNNTREMERNCIYDEREIPNGCQCKKLDLIVCSNQTRMPQHFPKIVVAINLFNNSINLENDDTIGLYENLTYLNLGHNNISHIPSRFLHNARQLRKLFLQHNQIETFPHNFFSPLISLKWFYMKNNFLRDFNLRLMGSMQKLQFLELSGNLMTLLGMHFPYLPHLNELFLDNNLITTLNTEIFMHLRNLTLISVRNNQICHISASTFNHLSVLKEIRLSDNPIVQIDSQSFAHLRKLNALYLDNLKISVDNNLLSTINVSFLSLKGISYEKIDFNAIERIGKLEHIVYKKFVYCSNTASVKKCFPKSDGISSTSDILEKATLRYAIWFMGFLTCVGNFSVLWGRFRDENRSVSLVIRNLAFSDMIMGIYLIIIGYKDTIYRDVYHENSSKWINSWECAFSGILAMTSAEVSIFILTFMSIERFLLISDPFGHHKLDTKFVMLSLYAIWLIGVSIAILPVILFRSSTKFYGVYNGPTCFPLFIEEVYPTGWIYSAFVFLGINFTLLVLIAVLYTTLLFSIFRTRRATSLNFFDCEFAIRFFFIVLTDASCWLPIIILKFMAFYDVEISGDLYSWIVIFVLPLNSAVNPLLFTYTTPKYRDQIFATFTKQSLKKQELNSNQITADDSQTTKVSLLYTSNGSIAKWKIFIK